jgi:hypothetical protein
MLQFLRENFRNDFDIAHFAINQSGYAFNYISQELKNNEGSNTLALEDDKITDKDLITKMFPKDGNLNPIVDD